VLRLRLPLGNQSQEHKLIAAMRRHTHHQKSSTVSKEYTGRNPCPYLFSVCLVDGLSNQRVHLCSSWCFLLKSGVSPSGCCSAMMSDQGSVNFGYACVDCVW
jgi:hypothetical protein